VRSDGEYSTVRDIEYGVLYLDHFCLFLFIDDVSGVIHSYRFHIHADD
jgi:hypothetical protein